MNREVSSNRRRRRDRDLSRDNDNLTFQNRIEPVFGGLYQPLSSQQIQAIHGAILNILEKIGISFAAENVVERVVGAGGTLGDDGRLRMPGELVEEALAEIPKNISLCGQNKEHDMLLSGARVHMGSGGAAPLLLDMETGRYRDSTLQDLYDAARIVDCLSHIHFFSRSLVARDIPDNYDLDINTAYACLRGTSKHVCVSASQGHHVKDIATICEILAGSRENFVARPFLSMNINHVVPPLRFHKESCDVLEQCALLGIPAHVNIFAQVGASTPVTQAGAIAQSAAESIAGLVFAWLVNPEAKLIFGAKPMITDLRTGGMSSGGGEQAVVMAGMTQLAQHYGLSNVSIAGATDSKTADAQSGYEKSLSVSLAALAGSNLITQSCGMHASLMGCALESYVIDNDMLGSIQSSLRPLEVSAETLSIDSIDRVVHSEGHFLGEPETMARMKSDFVYPDIADRTSVEEWEKGGGKGIHEVAKKRARNILANHFPTHIADDVDKEIRKQFSIKLSVVGGQTNA